MFSGVIRENKIKNDYYVYFHKDSDGKIFYVGKGRGKRAWQTTNRSKDWKKISSQGFSVELFRENISEQEALDTENDLILNLEGLVNKLRFTEIDSEDYSQYFAYDPTSPSGLTRIKYVVAGRGCEMGTLGSCGHKRTRENGLQYWGIMFKSRCTPIHRIIWKIINGKIPQGFVVDHIDGNSLNNNISNLRIISRAENRRNSKKPKGNTSGVVGVGLHTNKKNNSYWYAKCYGLDGKVITKTLSVLKYGYDEAFRLACQWREDQIRLLNEQGAGYTERHGT